VQTEITDFPIIDLEFDCRGNIDDVVTIHDNLTGPPDARNHVLLSAGEIKSSFEGVAKATSQLLKRLLVLKKGVELTCGPTFEILLEGIIFLPAEPEKLEARLNMKIHITVVLLIHTTKNIPRNMNILILISLYRIVTFTIQPIQSNETYECFKMYHSPPSIYNNNLFPLTP
jgi:hypothetical protein